MIKILYSLIIRIFYPAAANQHTAVQTKEKIKESQSTVKVTTIAVEPIRISKVDQPLHWTELSGAFRKKQLDSSNLLLNPLSILKQ